MLAPIRYRLAAVALASVLLARIAPSQTGAITPITITRSQHFRLSVPNDFVRIAVGDPDMLSAEAIDNRELLLLGKSAGRTTLLVWFRDGSVTEYICTIQRDLSLLRSSLKLIHSSIEVEIAPDRDAIVLTGQVPDVTYARAAEAAARNYLDAGQSTASARVLIQTTPAQNAPADQPAAAAVPQDIVRVPAAPVTGGAVINLIRLDSLPPLVEAKIADAIQPLGGSVSVRRILKGQLLDDAKDVFVLEGRVPNQVALMRILTLAAQIATGEAVNDDSIRVLADESGALAQGVGGGGTGGGIGVMSCGGGTSGFGGSVGGGGGGGGGGGRSLQNQLRRNIGRAKAIEVAGGRVISFLDVTDLPQVRVDIRLYEVDRNKLRTFTPNSAFTAGTSRAGITVPPNRSLLPPGSTSTEFASILGFIGGTLISEAQLTAGHFAMDIVLSYLEQQQIARNLASPSLTVLSGEFANFQVGGDIPIQQAFSVTGQQGAPTTGVSPFGVFSTIDFLTFGIQLCVRPLVGDDDTLTLDVIPTISTPDADLTASIRQNTGTNPATTALQSRFLRTSARLQDGQSLLVGGLLSHNVADQQSSTPGIRDIPGLGSLFKGFNRADDSLELIIVLNPVIVRDPLSGVELWQYPNSSEFTGRFSETLPQKAVEAGK